MCVRPTVTSIISEIAKIGNFDYFLATFGIESVIRLMEIFSKHFFLLKTSKGSETY